LILTTSLGILQKIKKKDLKWFFLLTLFEPLLYFLGETFGLKLVSSTLGSVFISTIPLFVPMAAWLVYREKVSILTLAGIIISVIGVLFVIMEKNLSFEASVPGILLIFVAVFTAVGYSMVIRHLANDYSPVTIVTWQNIFGLIAFIPIFYFTEFPDLQWSAYTSEIITNIIILGIFPSSLSYMFFTYAVREIGVNKASVFSNMIPVLTAIFAYFILDESLPFVKIIGIIIVIFALTLSQLDNFRKTNKSGTSL
jgi:drug/metabolite transporter (DMT)-like permease